MKEKIIVRIDTKGSKFSKTGLEMPKSTCDWKLDFYIVKEGKALCLFTHNCTKSVYDFFKKWKICRRTPVVQKNGGRILDWIKPSRRLLFTEPTSCEKLLKEEHYEND